MQPSNAICFRENGMECLVSTLTIGEKRLRIALVYRSPSVLMPNFVVMLTRLLQYVDSANDATMVLGDFNCDVTSSNYAQLERLMGDHGLTQIVQNATTDRANLIDHV